MRIRKTEIAYRNWLIEKVNFFEGRDYKYLLRELYNIKFFYSIKYDDDRAKDGLYLRELWADSAGYYGDLAFGEANILEVIIGITGRIEDQIFASRWVEEWDFKRIFWGLIENLGLFECYGALTENSLQKIYTSCTNWCEKRNKENVFCTTKNVPFAKNMAIWGQMQAYIAEKWPISDSVAGNGAFLRLF